MFDLGFLQAVEELPGLGGQAFDLAALAFGVQGVEGQRGFARAAQAGDDHQAVAGNGQVDVLQIVLAGADDFDGVHRRNLSEKLSLGFRGGREGSRVLSSPRLPPPVLFQPIVLRLPQDDGRQGGKETLETFC